MLPPWGSRGGLVATKCRVVVVLVVMVVEVVVVVVLVVLLVVVVVVLVVVVLVVVVVVVISSRQAKTSGISVRHFGESPEVGRGPCSCC